MSGGSESRSSSAVPKIVADVSKDLSSFAKESDEGIEQLDDNETDAIEIPQTSRRPAKGNIFSDVNKEDIQRISLAHQAGSND